MGHQRGGQDAIVGNVKLAGFGWVKHQIEWPSIETAAGQYDWGELDAIVQRRRRPPG